MSRTGQSGLLRYVRDVLNSDLDSDVRTNASDLQLAAFG